jgi:hypothetical protein
MEDICDYLNTENIIIRGENVFPFFDIICAEMITCVGKQCLQHMINHLTNKGI